MEDTLLKSCISGVVYIACVTVVCYVQLIKILIRGYSVEVVRLDGNLGHA